MWAHRLSVGMGVMGVNIVKLSNSERLGVVLGLIRIYLFQATHRPREGRIQYRATLCGPTRVPRFPFNNLLLSSEN